MAAAAQGGAIVGGMLIAYPWAPPEHQRLADLAADAVLRLPTARDRRKVIADVVAQLGRTGPPHVLARCWAAEQLLGAHDVEGAEAHLQEAWAASAPGGVERAVVCLQRSHCATRAGNAATAARWAHEAAAVAHAAAAAAVAGAPALPPAARLAATADATHGACLRASGRAAEAAAVLRGAVDALRGFGAPAAELFTCVLELALALDADGGGGGGGGGDDEAVGLLQEARRGLAEAQAPGVALRAFVAARVRTAAVGLAAALLRRGRVAEALPLLDDAAAAAAAERGGGLCAHDAWLLAWGLFQCGEHARAAAFATSVLRELRVSGDDAGARRVSLLLAACASAGGRPWEAEAVLRAVQHVGGDAERAHVMVELGRVLMVDLGQPRAAPRLREAEQLLRGAEALGGGPAAAWALGVCLARRGELREAEARLRAAHEAAHRRPAGAPAAEAAAAAALPDMAADLAACLFLRGDEPAEVEAEALLRGGAAGGGAPPAGGAAAAVLGALLARRALRDGAPTDEAEGLLRPVVAATGPGAADARVDLAACLWARAALREGGEGAAAALEEAEALLRDAHELLAPAGGAEEGAGERRARAAQRAAAATRLGAVVAARGGRLAEAEALLRAAGDEAALLPPAARALAAAALGGVLVARLAAPGAAAPAGVAAEAERALEPAARGAAGRLPALLARLGLAALARLGGPAAAAAAAAAELADVAAGLREAGALRAAAAAEAEAEAAPGAEAAPPPACRVAETLLASDACLREGRALDAVAPLRAALEAAARGADRGDAAAGAQAARAAALLAAAYAACGRPASGVPLLAAAGPPAREELCAALRALGRDRDALALLLLRPPGPRGQAPGECRLALGECRLALGDPGGAESPLRGAAGDAGAPPDVRRRALAALARCARLGGRPPADALAFARLAVPACGEAHLEAGLALAALGDAAAAEAHLQHAARELGPAQGRARREAVLALVRLLLARADCDAARLRDLAVVLHGEVLAPAREERDPGALRAALALLCDAHCALGAPAAAEPLARELVSLAPGCARARRALGGCLLMQGKLRAALGELQAARAGLEELQPPPPLDAALAAVQVAACARLLLAQHPDDARARAAVQGDGAAAALRAALAALERAPPGPLRAARVAQAALELGALELARRDGGASAAALEPRRREAALELLQRAVQSTSTWAARAPDQLLVAQHALCAALPPGSDEARAWRIECVRHCEDVIHAARRDGSPPERLLALSVALGAPRTFRVNEAAAAAQRVREAMHALGDAVGEQA